MNAVAEYAIADNVAVVTMANPPANLFSAELATALREALNRARRDGARALVLAAEGSLFSGGADVNLFHGTSAADARELFTDGLRLIAEIEDAPFPVIAAVHGLCLAAGLEIALACDLIVAADDAQFAQVEAFIGAATFLGGVNRLAERAGPARAAQIVFDGIRYSANDFERWNIVNRVVPAGNLHAESVAWAQRLASGPTAAHVVTKRLIRHTMSHGARSADDYLLDVATPLFDTQDMQRAVGLLLEQGPQRFMARHHEVVFTGR